LGIVRPVSFAAATLMGASVLVAPTALANGCIFANFGGGTGTSSDPLLVATADHLDELKGDSNCWGYEFLQTADILMGGATWTSGIGSGSPFFTGTYDGDGFTISDLTISESTANNLGLFGTVASGSTVRNVGFLGSVSGASNAGGLAGTNEGLIENSFVSGSGSVSSTSIYAGGLVGYNDGGTVSNSYSRVPVSTTGGWAGGLVGLNGSGDGGPGTITNSFSSGRLTGPNIGGLVGRQSASTVNNSFWDIQASAAPTSEGGVGKTTGQMTSISTFSGWSIASGWDATATWGICSSVNSGYPFLTAFYTEDPCASESSAVGSSTPARYQFTFWLPDGRQCTSISPITVTAGTLYELPGEDAACAVTGSVVTGWRIPGQSAAFAPGRRVQVSGSQQFTAVLEYSWVDVVFDANVASLDQCLSDGNDSTMRDASWSVPRELLLAGEIPVPESAPCTPPGHSLIGWSTEPTGNRTPLSTLPAPAVDSDGNAANIVHLYAIWSAS